MEPAPNQLQYRGDNSRPSRPSSVLSAIAFATAEALAKEDKSPTPFAPVKIFVPRSESCRAGAWRRRIRAPRLNTIPVNPTKFGNKNKSTFLRPLFPPFPPVSPKSFSRKSIQPIPVYSSGGIWPPFRPVCCPPPSPSAVALATVDDLRRLASDLSLPPSGIFDQLRLNSVKSDLIEVKNFKKLVSTDFGPWTFLMLPLPDPCPSVSIRG